jgi:hypothetical protein
MGYSDLNLLQLYFSISKTGRHGHGALTQSFFQLHDAAWFDLALVERTVKTRQLEFFI